MKVLLLVSVMLIARPAHSQSLHKRSTHYLAHIFLHSGEQLNTRWMHADSTGITVQLLSDSTQVFHIIPENIRRIDIRKSNASTRNSLLGALIGFTIGFGGGWIAYSDGHDVDINHIGRAAGTGVLSAFTGAFVGFASGSLSKTYWILGQKDNYLNELTKWHKYNNLDAR